MSNSEIPPDEQFELHDGARQLPRLGPGRAAMWLLAKLLSRLVRNGHLTVIDPCCGTWRFGGGDGLPFQSD